MDVNGETKNKVETEELVDLPYGVDYAKSNRAGCSACKNKIDKGELRLAVRLPSQKWDGIQDVWHHFDCFWIKKRNALTEAAIRGFEALRWEDQQRIRDRLNPLSIPDVAVTETKTQAPSAGLSVEHAKSSSGKCTDCKEKIVKDSLRVKLKSKFYHPACLAKLALFSGTVNDIVGIDSLNEEELAELKTAFLVKAELDGPSSPKKARLSDNPERLEALKTQSQFLWSVLDEIRGQFDKEQVKTLLTLNGTCGSNSKGLSLEAHVEWLADLIVFGGLPICDLCGNNTLRYHQDLHTYKCCAYLSSGYARCMFATRTPTRTDFQVSDEFLSIERFVFLKKYHNKRLVESGRLYSISVEKNEVSAVKPNEMKKNAFKEEEENRRCIVKNGTAVDPKCEIAEHVHVYIEDKVPFQALLTSADLASNRNTFYKLQLCEHDSRSNYYVVFRAWGRVGTRGGTKTEHFDSLEEAKESFQQLFFEKSQNYWGHEFLKVPGGLDLVELEVDESKIEEVHKLDPTSSTSSLPIQLREIISLFFDVHLMAKQMAEFELDSEKLPLAKLAKTQILRAHSILSELSTVLEQEAPSKSAILDLSNQFYTLIPHSSGIGRLSLINNVELLKNKADMLDSLLELEIAYKLIKQEEEAETEDSKIDPFDRYYSSLNCQIELLSKECEEYKLIKLYINNGHMSTHHFKVKIKEIFKVQRAGEKERYIKATKKIGNKRLLWHGSRTSNFAGILAQGLRIAPPEAPANGYMFGKGVYFADCVSKSAQYCSTSGRSDAFLLLAEVAVGTAQLEKYAANVVKPKKGFDSVKGMGRTAPDEKGSITFGNVLVPCGKAQTIESDHQLSLLYNEFIVYNEAQTYLRYLVHADVVY